MPTAAFTTLGCKVNQYETQRILDDFESRGFGITEFNKPADVYVINTCSVTQAAERKSHYMVRKVATQNPRAIVVMTGCYGEMARIKGEMVSEASLIVPNHQKLHTLEHLLRAHPELADALDSQPILPVKSAARRTRATVKVQDGCNVYCTFCSIPYTRKFMHSRPLDELIAEAELRTAQGYRELVVTGVLVGAYGQERGFGTTEMSDSQSALPINTQPHSWTSDTKYSRPDLADVLLRLAQVPGIERVRLSSIEPTQVTDRLLQAFASESKLCPHLHIPLQSGDSSILRAMNRPYDQQYYLERCQAAYSAIPDLAITSDIMVGFPYEDRDAFENTLEVVRTVGFARAHLFRYSPRPSTPAADFPHQISDAEKEARSKELTAACRASQQRFIQKYLGRTLEVLVENREGHTAAGSDEAELGSSGNEGNTAIESDHDGSGNRLLLSGYTGNYIRVQFTGGSHLIRTVVKVHLTEPTTEGAIGEVGGAHFAPQEAPPDADFIPLATFAAALA